VNSTRLPRLALVLAILFAPPCALPAQEASDVSSIGDEVVLCAPELLAGMPAHVRDYFVWPSPRAMIARRATGMTADGAKTSTGGWLRRVLQARWVPVDVSDRLIALNEDVRDDDPVRRGELAAFDAVRVRYQSQAHCFQLTATSFAMALVVRAAKSSQGERVEPGSHKAFAAEAITMFLNDAEKIAARSFGTIVAKGGVSCGKPDLRQWASDWYGLVTWWTDGTAFAFVAPKYSGEPYLPRMVKDWF